MYLKETYGDSVVIWKCEEECARLVYHNDGLPYHHVETWAYNEEMAFSLAGEELRDDYQCDVLTDDEYVIEMI